MPPAPSGARISYGPSRDPVLSNIIGGVAEMIKLKTQNVNLKKTGLGSTLSDVGQLQPWDEIARFIREPAARTRFAARHSSERGRQDAREGQDGQEALDGCECRDSASRRGATTTDSDSGADLRSRT